jgi:hypothetical protein
VTGPQTPAPAAPDLPIPQPGRVTRPAGARAEHSAAPAGFQGEEFRRKVKAALAANNAGLRRGRFTRSAKKTGPGMIRKPPPQTPGDAA